MRLCRLENLYIMYTIEEYYVRGNIIFIYWEHFLCAATFFIATYSATLSISTKPKKKKKWNATLSPLKIMQTECGVCRGASLRFHSPLGRRRRPTERPTDHHNRLVSNATNVPRALVQVARVGAEKNHVCIYISAGINHSTEKSRHKTQTGSQRGTAHPLNTQWPYVADVHRPPAPSPKNAFIIHRWITNATVCAFHPPWAFAPPLEFTRLIGVLKRESSVSSINRLCASCAFLSHHIWISSISQM